MLAGGNVINQTWTPAGNPYVIQGDITVPSGAFLTIQAGTLVQFASSDGQATGVDTARVELVVNGTLNVNGSATNRVTFEAQSGTGPSIWYGIEINSSAAAATIRYADVQNAVNALTTAAAGSALQLSNCTFSFNGAGIQCTGGNPTISQIQSYSNTTYGIIISGAGGPTLVQSLLFGNNFGAYVNNGISSPTTTFVNCVIHDNTSTGVYLNSGNTVLVRNCEVTQNAIGLDSSGSGSLTATYNDVWGNSTTNYLHCSAGVGSISSDPLYTAASAHPPNFRLRAGSPAIDAGDNSALPAGVATDLDGAPRFRDDPQTPDSGNGSAPLIDLGAYEYQPPPVLLISRTTPGSSTLLWSTNVPGFVLESNATAFTAGGWIPVGIVPTVSGSNNSVVIQSLSPSTWFRLKK